MGTLLENKTDGELIALYVSEKQEKAFDVLLRRHYNKIHKRFCNYLKDEHTANDLCQQLWMRVLSSLKDYQHSGKFEHYINTIATNILKDHWRSKNVKSELPIHDDEGKLITEYEPVDDLNQSSTEKDLIMKETVNHLIHKLIPSLPCDQRLVYLLRHESEYWDDKQQLQWQHLADLNNLDVEEVSNKFEETRDKLFKNATHEDAFSELECEEKIIFLLWTQAQRIDKKKKYTESYFAGLLNMPVNTFKTKYRTGLKKLSEGLQDYETQQ